MSAAAARLKQHAPTALTALALPSRHAALTYTAKVLGLGLAYFAAAKGGLALAYENSSVTAVWPPTGIALAALVLGGRRLWPGVALGALLANSSTGVPLFTVLGITAGNTLEALIGAHLLVRVAGFRPSLERARDVLALAVLAAMLSTMVSATVGVASLYAGHAISAGELASGWRTWWLGDLGGDLLVAPLVFVFAGGVSVSRRSGRAVEAVAMVLAVAGVSCLVFSSHTSRVFLIFPVLIWAALRFGPRGVAASSVLVAGIAAAFTTNGLGPFVASTPDGSLLLSQSFVGITALVSLLLAAVTAERKTAETTLRRAHRELEETVRDRTAVLRRSQAWLTAAQKMALLGSWEWDIRADTVTWSDELYGIYGVSPDDFEPSYRGYLDRLHPDDRGRVEAAITEAYADHQPFAFDERILRPDGSVRTLASRGKVFVDEAGRPVRMLGVCQDVTARHREQEALRRAEEHARRVVEEAHEAFISTDDLGVIIDWNRQAESVFGWSRTEAIGRPFAETVIPERHWAAHFRGLDHFLATGDGQLLGRRLELTARHRDGHEFPVELSISALPTPDGCTFNALLHDISERKGAERAIQDAEERFRGAFEEAPIGMALVELDGRFRQVNGALCEITGYSADELGATSFESVAHPDDRAQVRSKTELLVAGEASSYRVDVRCVHVSGNTVWVALRAALLRDENGEPAHLLIQLIDITHRRRYEEKLQYMADHDPLTGLLNRRSFDRELGSHLEHGRRYGMSGAALVLDVDRLKDVNDTLGHNAGDELLRRIARALGARLRETDVLARLSGDEFAVLLPNTDPEGARQAARALVAAVHEQEVQTRDGRSRTITASVGVAMIDDEGVSGEDVIVNADLAMYDAKAAGRGRIAFFRPDEEHVRTTKARLTWVERIRDALENDGFTLLAQPIVELSTGRVSQHELLLRMKDQAGDLIPPAAFLDVAERLDLIQEIDRWVVRSAVAMLEEHESRGRALTLEVNLSGRSLGDPELLEVIEAELERSGVSPERLIFEVTETAAVANMAAARAFGERLSELGCRFALDDFGAGFGSFYYLKHLPFDYVKIDGEFVRNCRNSQTDRLVIQAVIDLARGLEKQTIAEIVGDDETVQLLTRLGVDYAQGYHLRRPGPLAEVAAAC